MESAQASLRQIESMSGVKMRQVEEAQRQLEEFINSRMAALSPLPALAQSSPGASLIEKYKQLVQEIFVLFKRLNSSPNKQELYDAAKEYREKAHMLERLLPRPLSDDIKREVEKRQCMMAVFLQSEINDELSGLLLRVSGDDITLEQLEGYEEEYRKVVLGPHIVNELLEASPAGREAAKKYNDLEENIAKKIKEIKAYLKTTVAPSF